MTKARKLRRGAAVLSIAVLTMGATAGPALAAGHHGATKHHHAKKHHAKKHHHAKKAAPAKQTAVIYPLLEFFQFGDEIGAPIVCGTGSSLIGSGAAYFGVSKSANGLIDAINQGCAAIVKYGDKFIDTGIADSSAGSALNPVVNPVIASFGKSVHDFGTSYGTALNPVGPTIAGAGATIDFFEGN